MSVSNTQKAALHKVLEHGFVVLTTNPDEPADACIEAWAFWGPLDFDYATPVCFGRGGNVTEALHALIHYLPPPE